MSNMQNWFFVSNSCNYFAWMLCIFLQMTLSFKLLHPLFCLDTESPQMLKMTVHHTSLHLRCSLFKIGFIIFAVSGFFGGLPFISVLKPIVWMPLNHHSSKHYFTVIFIAQRCSFKNYASLNLVEIWAVVTEITLLINWWWQKEYSPGMMLVKLNKLCDV